MEANVDPDTTRKVELINHKIDEINQRRYGLRMTKIEDELDKQELDEYIKSLNLTSEQQKVIEGFNKTNQRYVQNQSSIYYVMMFISIFIEAYLTFAIYDLLMKPAPLDMLQTAYLYLMVIVFILNAVYVLKYLRILR